MENDAMYRVAGWSAFLSGIAAILTLVTVPALMTLGLPYDLISGYAEIFWFALIIPIAVALHQRLIPFSKALSTLTLVTGILGLSYSTIVTFLINFGPAGFGDNGIFLTATIGFWFLVTSILLMLNKLQPPGLSWLGILIGISYMIGLLGLLLKDTLIFVFGIHIILVTLIYPIWAFWTGSVMLGQFRSNSAQLHQKAYQKIN